MSMKVVLKLELYDDKAKTKAVRILFDISAVDSVGIDMKNRKMMVIGDMDPVDIVIKLRKLCHAEIVSVGPAKEAEKNEERAAQERKEEPKKADDVFQTPRRPIPSNVLPSTVEENPNDCVIV
ncbi:hypothetical protein ACOSQ3_004143 [Xanthoceras sorbifolium]